MKLSLQRPQSHATGVSWVTPLSPPPSTCLYKFWESCWENRCSERQTVRQSTKKAQWCTLHWLVCCPLTEDYYWNQVEKLSLTLATHHVSIPLSCANLVGVVWSELKCCRDAVQSWKNSVEFWVKGRSPQNGSRKSKFSSLFGLLASGEVGLMTDMLKLALFNYG